MPPRVLAVPYGAQQSASFVSSCRSCSPAPGHRPGRHCRTIGRVAGRSSPALATKRRSSKVNPVCVAAHWVRVGFCYKTSQKPGCRFRTLTRRPPSDGFGLRARERRRKLNVLRDWEDFVTFYHYPRTRETCDASSHLQRGNADQRGQASR